MSYLPTITCVNMAIALYVILTYYNICKHGYRYMSYLPTITCVNMAIALYVILTYYNMCKHGYSAICHTYLL